MTMDDLNSRRLAIETTKDPVILGYFMYVPAESLDKLCERLGGYAAPPIRSPLALYGSYKEAWKAFLLNWMEELDGTD